MRQLQIKIILLSLIFRIFRIRFGWMRRLHTKCICSKKIADTLNANLAFPALKWKIVDTRLRQFEHARLISFPSLWQDSGMRAQLHRNVHFTLGYSRWEVKCSIKCDINVRRWKSWMPAPRESVGILLTGEMSAFCSGRRNSGIWTTLRPGCWYFGIW